MLCLLYPFITHRQDDIRGYPLIRLAAQRGLGVDVGLTY